MHKITADDIEIPGMPDIAMNVLALLEDEFCPLKKLEEVILEDQALTVNILKIANAPFYKTGKSINTISEAIMAIGIHNMVAFVSVISLTNQLTGANFDRSLMQHAISVSLASALLAKKSKVITEEEALVAGLLHDIGKTVLLANAPARYSAVKEKIKKEKTPFIEAERNLLGFDHCEIGGRLAEKWKLPELYRYAIKKHHDEEVKNFESSNMIEYKDLLCYIVRIADKVVLDSGIGVGKSAEKKAGEMLDMLKINESVYIDIVKKISYYNSK